MRLTKSTKRQLYVQRIVFIMLLFGCVGLLSWLSNRYSIQYDWSANNRNSISQQSIEILNNMDDVIYVNVYVQNKDSVRAAVTEILQRYKRVKENFEFKLINPDVDFAIAQQDGVKQYGQVIIKYKDRKEELTSLSEQSISSALLRLGRDKQRRISFITGHGERDPDISDNLGYSILKKQLQSNGYRIDKLHLLQKDIGDDADVIVLASPSNRLLDGERGKIMRHLDSGGDILWLVDPGELQSLDQLAESLSLEFYKGMIVDNNIDLRKTLQIEHPAIIPVVEYYPHAITEKISYNTLFPTSRGINFVGSDAGEDTWNASSLFQSFAQSWSEARGISSKIVFDSDDGDIAGPITIGIALERTIDPKKSRKKASQRVVVIGDSDFLANSYIGAGANLSLGLNIINWLSGDDDLVTISPKVAPDTKLEISDVTLAFIGIGFFALVPLILVITGFALWIKRKNA